MNTWINELAAWLETTSLHGAMQTVEWAVPAVQTVHILAIAAVFASSLALSLRALNLVGVDWSPAQWSARLNGWVVGGLIVLLLSGLVLICGEPGRSLNNAFFQTKMLLLILAIVLFRPLSVSMRRLSQSEQRVPGATRVLAVVIVAVWIAIIICGRWIAYT